MTTFAGPGLLDLHVEISAGHCMALHGTRQWAQGPGSTCCLLYNLQLPRMDLTPCKASWDVSTWRLMQGHLHVPYTCGLCKGLHYFSAWSSDTALSVQEARLSRRGMNAAMQKAASSFEWAVRRIGPVTTSLVLYLETIGKENGAKQGTSARACLPPGLRSCTAKAAESVRCQDIFL